MADWPLQPLREVTTKIGSGATPRGGKSVYVAEGTTFIRSQNVYDNQFSGEDIARISTDAAHALNGVTVESGDVLVNITGESVTRTCSMDARFLPARVSQHVSIVRADRRLVDPAFLLYVLLSPPLKARMHALSQAGATRRALTKSHLEGLRVPVPPLPEQQRIAGVLGAFDDLIETNRRLADDCLRLARLAAATALADQDWSSNLPDYVTVAKGFSYRSSELQATGGQHLLNLKNVGRGGAFRFDGYKRLETARHKRIQEVDDGDIVVSLTDLTQARDIIARAFRVERRGLRGTIVASLDLAVVRPKAGVSREFVWAVLMDPKFRAHAVPYCNGTTVLHMKDAALNDFSIPEPAESLMRRIDHEVRPLLEASTLCQTEADHLASQRDELLPLLMSGKVRVSEVEGSLP